MSPYKELLLLVVTLLVGNHRQANGLTCEGLNEAYIAKTNFQIALMEKQISTLTDTMKNVAWSVMSMEMTFNQFKQDMQTIGTSSSSEAASSSVFQRQDNQLSEGCANKNLAELLAQYLKGQSFIEIKLSNGSSLTSGGDKTEAREEGHILKSCKEAEKSGVFNLKSETAEESFLGYCDKDYEGGGWLLIQHRFNGSVDFYRNWTDYKRGFGEFDGEFWLGNDRLYQITKDSPREIHFVMTDWEKNTAVAKYTGFQIGNEEQQYVLKSLGTYSGTAGDSLTRNVKSKFSTRDMDNDSASGDNCAIKYFGAWWYDNCHLGNLNGKYLKGTVTEYATSMCWSSFKGFHYGLKISRILLKF